MSDPFGLGLRHGEPKPSLFRRLMQVPFAVATSLLVVVGIVVGSVAVTGKVFHPKPSNDFVGTGTGTVLVEVHPGQSLSGIGQTLVAAGVVKSVTAFSDAANDNAQAQSIQPGTYQLHLQMSAASAIDLLVSPDSLVGGRVTIPEGLRISRVEQLIAASQSTIKVADIEAALGRPGSLGLPDYAAGQPEGFLYPATYDVDSTTTATSLLISMVARFNQVAASIDLDQGAARLHLTSYQVVTIASLIEAEVKRPQDYSQVAEVIINRLHKGMPLELDSTVNYALGTTDPFLTAAQLKTPSPFNTYLHAGLPPTPIDSPGQDALTAALNPAQGDYLYFVTTNPITGDTTFTASLKEAKALQLVAQKNAAAIAAGSAPASPAASAP
jgi:UPF0755 protein